MVKVLVCLPIAVARLVVLVGLQWRLGRENEILEEREGNAKERKMWMCIYIYIYVCMYIFAFLKLTWHFFFSFLLSKIFNINLEATYVHHMPCRYFYL